MHFELGFSSHRHNLKLTYLLCIPIRLAAGPSSRGAKDLAPDLDEKPNLCRRREPADHYNVPAAHKLGYKQCCHSFKVYLPTPSNSYRAHPNA